MGGAGLLGFAYRKEGEARSWWRGGYVADEESRCEKAIAETCRDSLDYIFSGSRPASIRARYTIQCCSPRAGFNIDT
jgi:hypothetical protein